MTTHEASKESQAAAQPEAGPSGAAADASGADGQEKKPGCSSCEIMRRLFEGPCGDQVAAFVACYQKKGQDELRGGRRRGLAGGAEARGAAARLAVRAEARRAAARLAGRVGGAAGGGAARRTGRRRGGRRRGSPDGAEARRRGSLPPAHCLANSNADDRHLAPALRGLLSGFAEQQAANAARLDRARALLRELQPEPEPEPRRAQGQA
eukprot:tig00000219_g19470.t1